MHASMLPKMGSCGHATKLNFSANFFAQPHGPDEARLRVLSRAAAGAEYVRGGLAKPSRALSRKEGHARSALGSRGAAAAANQHSPRAWVRAMRACGGASGMSAKRVRQRQFQL